MAKRKKRWSQIVEAHGVKVRVFERENSSNLQYSIVHNGKKVRGSLKTSDRKLAKERAKAVAQSLAVAQINGHDLQSLTLAQVFNEYFAKKVPHFTLKWRRRSETARDLFLRAFGASKRVSDIAQSDLDHYAELRRSGKLVPEATRRLAGVRDGTIAGDISWLSTVFNWARGVKVGGRRLLATNPLEGLERPKERNILRPVASHDRYLQTRGIANKVDPMGRLRCMIAIARYTGRRENAICQLEAADVLRGREDVRRELAALGLDESAADHFPRGGIRWRAETDKVGVNSITPLSATVREEIDRYLEKNPRLGATPLIPAPQGPINADQP